MDICIYCKKEKSNFENREHVIPQAFGTFEPTNLILNDVNKKDKTVCDDCNHKLGRELDEKLACGSYEGHILRTKFLGKTPRDTFHREITIQLADGPHKGVYVKINEYNTIEILPQIGLKRKDGNWDYFLIDKIDSIEKNKYDLSENSICALCCDEQAITDVFKKIEIEFKKNWVTDLKFSKDEKFLTEIKFQIDKQFKRSIAKIAFNYFAYFNSKIILLNECFDQIRAFIFEDNSSGKDLVKVSNDPILEGDTNNTRVLGHIITINKNPYNAIIAQVSLFNYFKYTIVLSECFDHSDLQVGFGDFFNTNNGKIIRIEKRQR